MAVNQRLTVMEVAQRSGFAASALRFYEREGLIEAERSSGGQRRYDRQVLRRLAFIRAARNVGLTLEDVKAELAQLPESRTPTPGDCRRSSAPGLIPVAGPETDLHNKRDRESEFPIPASGP